MDLVQDILLEYLDYSKEVGDFNVYEVNRSIEAIKVILLFVPENTPLKHYDKSVRYCEKLLNVFQNFQSTLNSFTVVKDILKLLVYLSKNYETLDNFRIDHHKGSLLKFVVSLSASNFCHTGEPFKIFKSIFDSLFGARLDDFRASYPAQVMCYGILDALLRFERFELGRSEKLIRKKILLKLLEFLDDDKRCGSAKVILRRDVHSINMDHALTEVLDPFLQNSSTDDPGMFEDKEKIYEIIIQLFAIDPKLIRGTVESVKRNMNDKVDAAKKEIAFAVAFKLFTHTSPGLELDDLWKRLICQFFRPDLKKLYEDDVKMLCKYSPALLNSKVDHVRNKWLDLIIELITLGKYNPTPFLKIFAETEKEGRTFFSIKEVCTKIEPLLKIGSDQELKDKYKETFLRFLCEVYQNHTENGFLEAAFSLAFFILHSFTRGAATSKDWALVRVLNGILTAQGEEPRRRVWHLVTLHLFCHLNDDNSMGAALREAFRYSRDVERTCEEFLRLETVSPRELERFSKRLCCEVTPNSKHLPVVEYILNKAKEDTFRTKLKTIISFESADRESKRAKAGIKMKTLLQGREEILGRFFATVECPVNADMVEDLIRRVKGMIETDSDQPSSNESQLDETSNKFFDSLPGDITLVTLTSTLHETVEQRPHLAFVHPETLDVLLRLLTSSHGDNFSKSLALRTIYAALNCGCSEEERKLPSHVKWSPEALDEIQRSCLEMLELNVRLVWKGEAQTEGQLMFARAVLKRTIRIIGRIGNPQDLRFLVERACQSSDSPPACLLSLATVGFIAAEEPLRLAFQEELTFVTKKILGGMMENLKKSISCIAGHMDCEWVNRGELPLKIQILVENYRAIGRLVRFCAAEQNAQPFLQLLANIFLHAIPQEEHSLAQLLQEHMETQAAQNLFCTAIAGIVRKESACAFLTILDSKVFRDKLTVDIILKLAVIAMDPLQKVRDTFTEKLNHGLCYIKDRVDDCGRSKGKLPTILAGLIPLTCLYRADCCREIDLKGRYTEEVLSTRAHLKVYAKSQRLFRHRYQNYALPGVPSDGYEQNIDASFPELHPEFLLAWLVPILAKLDFLGWYESRTQLENMEETQMTVLKLIYNCFQVVLNAMTDKAGGRPYLAYAVLKYLPMAIMHFVKYESSQEKERLILLCFLLKSALESHSNYRESEQQTHQNPNLFRILFSKGRLFYNCSMAQRQIDLYYHFSASFDGLLNKLKQMEFPQSIGSEGLLSLEGSLNDDNISREPGPMSSAESQNYVPSTTRQNATSPENTLPSEPSDDGRTMHESVVGMSPRSSSSANSQKIEPEIMRPSDQQSSDLFQTSSSSSSKRRTFSRETEQFMHTSTPERQTPRLSQTSSSSSPKRSLFSREKELLMHSPVRQLGSLQQSPSSSSQHSTKTRETEELMRSPVRQLDTPQRLPTSNSQHCIQSRETEELMLPPVRQLETSQQSSTGSSQQSIQSRETEKLNVSPVRQLATSQQSSTGSSQQSIESRETEKLMLSPVRQLATSQQSSTGSSQQSIQSRETEKLNVSPVRQLATSQQSSTGSSQQSIQSRETEKLMLSPVRQLATSQQSSTGSSQQSIQSRETEKSAYDKTGRKRSSSPGGAEETVKRPRQK